MHAVVVPVQEIFETIRENGFVEEQEMEQLYSTGLNKFLADRYVVGTCPKCGYEVPPFFSFPPTPSANTLWAIMCVLSA